MWTTSIVRQSRRDRSRGASRVRPPAPRRRTAAQYSPCRSIPRAPHRSERSSCDDLLPGSAAETAGRAKRSEGAAVQEPTEAKPHHAQPPVIRAVGLVDPADLVRHRLRHVTDKGAARLRIVMHPESPDVPRQFLIPASRGAEPAPEIRIHTIVK